jgi:hypothetical protein
MRAFGRMVAANQRHRATVVGHAVALVLSD